MKIILRNEFHNSETTVNATVHELKNMPISVAHITSEDYLKARQELCPNNDPMDNFCQCGIRAFTEEGELLDLYIE